MFRKLDFSKSYTQNWAKQSANLFAADIVGTTMEAVAIGNMGKLERTFPKATEFAVDMLNVPTKHFQDSIEKVLQYGKNFEGDEYYNKRMRQTRDERAKSYAKATFRYGMALGAGAVATYATEHHVLSKLTKAKPVPLGFYTADWIIHAGFIGLMATPMVAPTVDKAKQVVKAVTKTLGADEDTSEDIARLAAFSGIPNYSTFGVISAALYRDNKKTATSLEKLSHQLGITAEHLHHT